MSGQPTVDQKAVIEQLTIEWVSEILDEPDVSPQDNFVDLGGHSVLALRLSRHAKERFGAGYDVMVLFEKDLASAAAELASRVAGV